MVKVNYLWWQEGVLYHIYPLSFKDSNGDGKGDLPGIESKLDYLSWLGIDGIWLSPVYSSPMKDFGYDIMDYTDINHECFGTLDDFHRLIKEVHKRGMKLIMDFVPNHTSDQHPWFKESRSSRNNPKRDWYIWRDPAPDGGPPTNWISSFGGSAWEYDRKSGQYYYHAFLKEQPDLNWWNTRVQRAMIEVMRFWLDKGVDGFRVDVMWHLLKDKDFRDNPPNPDYREGRDPSYHQLVPAYSSDHPEVHRVVSKMRALMDTYSERVLIGEVYLPVNELVDYYGEQDSGAHLPTNFELILLPWNAERIFAEISSYEASLPPFGWPNWVLSNHDKSRVASRVGLPQAKIAAMLLLTLRGTPTMYYGDEIGMRDVPILPSMNLDPAEQKRDYQRTPMQWDSTEYAGFSSALPWLGVASDYREFNVGKQRNEQDSILVFYRNLIQLRRREPSLRVGHYRPVCVKGDIMVYAREDEKHKIRFIVVLNLGHDAGNISIPGRFSFAGKVVFATHQSRLSTQIERDIALQPDEGFIGQIE